MHTGTRVLLTFALLLGLGLHGRAATVSALFSRGYTVIPEPRKVALEPRDFPFNARWRVELDQGISANDIAVQTLHENLSSRFDITLRGTAAAAGVLRLAISPGAVTVGNAQDRDRGALARQAYRLELKRNAITVTANASQGLFYGVETLIQLLQPKKGGLWLPEGTIEDWPDLSLRQIYWDDAHHLDHMDVLKQAIRQAAFYKIDGFAIKLEGHFQYKSAPAVVEPYALTPAQLQELTNYGLRYYVQLVPYLDGPAHIGFILKHPEYARLREYPESNYELCATNPDSYKLLEGMYQDLLDANQGVKYFYLSTDEPYYIGLANNSQCQEAVRAKELGSVGKLLAEFVTKTATYLHDRGRTVFFWGEYPLKTEDIGALPSFMVNGEVYGPEFDPVFKNHGIRQMIYTSSEGEEKLFPDYFILPESKRVHDGYSGTPRVADNFEKISFDVSRKDADLVGEVNAGWADMGLHPETFWLGYVASAAAGWHPGSPSPRESMSAFYPLFYGAGVRGMDRVYQLMSEQAQFWNDSWDEIRSAARKPIWGNSYKIFNPPQPANDQTLPLPPAPSEDLGYSSDWAATNAKRLLLASESMAGNDALLGLLRENIRLAQFNRYNLEVYLSIAELCRQNLQMLDGIRRMDALLASAASQRKRNPKEAVESVDQALEIAGQIRLERNRALRDAGTTWYKSWFPRVATANGRTFLHELDDVKDHLPDRTVDMSYLVYRETLLPFGEWVAKIQDARNRFAETNHLAARDEPFDWKSFAN